MKQKQKSTKNTLENNNFEDELQKWNLIILLEFLTFKLLLFRYKTVIERIV